MNQFFSDVGRELLQLLPAIPAILWAISFHEFCHGYVALRCGDRTAELEGRIVLRNRKGIPQAEYGYVLRRRGGETELSLRDASGAEVPFRKDGNILGTDVTWSELALEYLWWDEVCAVVAMRKGGRTVRVWVDRKTGALMQAEEIADGKPVRRLWGTRIKKFGDRWMANVLEVETLGSGHRTKITVEKLQ